MISTYFCEKFPSTYISLFVESDLKFYNSYHRVEMFELSNIINTYRIGFRVVGQALGEGGHQGGDDHVKNFWV